MDYFIEKYSKNFEPMRIRQWNWILNNSLSDKSKEFCGVANVLVLVYVLCCVSQISTILKCQAF